MPLLNDIDLLVFDLDGTLVDSHYDLADAVNYALEQMGKPALPYEEIPSLLGSGIGKLLEWAARTDDAAALMTARRFFDEYYTQFHARKTVCYPGVMDTLLYFNRKKKAIFTNKAQLFTNGIVNKLELEPLFDYVLGAHPDRFPLKPHPAGLHLILGELKIAPHRALMVGDSTHDMEAARAAGLHTCAVTYGYRSTEELTRCRPDFMISRFEELRGLVEN